jgi:plasmid stabilization system protein ParE
MNIEFLQAAQAELDDAFIWYETQQKHLGRQFIQEFNAAVKRLSAFPQAYTEIEKGVRRCLVKRFPYGILYGINQDTIVIVAVAHLHREPNYWISRLNSLNS